MLKVGIGYDIHRLVKGRKLFIGGIEIPYSKGLLGHSDADVLLHAVCDAILGACACGDIGGHFPDTDRKYKDISSMELLKRVNAVARKNKFKISNIDAVVIAEEPRLAKFKDKMQVKISQALKIRKDAVNIKAKTNEGLDAVGRKEAVASYAAVLLTRGR